MPSKPYYNAQRTERARAKQAKKEEKLREREEAAARRKAGLDRDAAEAAPSDVPPPGEDSAEAPRDREA